MSTITCVPAFGAAQPANFQMTEGRDRSRDRPPMNAGERPCARAARRRHGVGHCTTLSKILMPDYGARLEAAKERLRMDL